MNIYYRKGHWFSINFHITGDGLINANVVLKNFERKKMPTMIFSQLNHHGLLKIRKRTRSMPYLVCSFKNKIFRQKYCYNCLLYMGGEFFCTTYMNTFLFIYLFFETFKKIYIFYNALNRMMLMFVSMVEAFLFICNIMPN